MANLKGYAGKILKVDLGLGEITTIPTSRYVPKYIGGRGIATRIYYEDVGPDVAAFDPENELIFMSGPLGGTLAPGSSRFCLVSKAPQSYPTESVADSNIGGDFGPTLKFAGYDGLIVRGRADKPCYLMIEDNKVKILPADGMWGKKSLETQRMIWKKHGPDTQTLIIGPAGENLSRIAIILHQSGCAFGQGGFGAVMGAKNIKAIAVKGNGTVAMADPKEVIKLREYTMKLVGPKHGEVKKGFLGHEYKNVAGYFQHWLDEGGMKTGLHKFAEQGKAKMGVQGCYGCPFGCRTTMKWAEGMNLTDGSTQCFEAFGYWQHWYKWSDVEGIAWEWNTLVNDLGLNSTEVTALYWLIQKGREEGFLTKENTGWDIDQMGKEKFDNGKFINCEFFYQHLNDIANGKGFGRHVAEGMARLADYITGDKKFGEKRDRAGYHYNLLFPKVGHAGGYRSHFNAINYGPMFYSSLAYGALGQRDPETKHIDNGFHNPFAYQPPLKKYIKSEDEQWHKMVPVLMKRLVGTDKPAIPPGFEEAEKAVRLYWQLNLETDCLQVCDWLMDDLRAIRFWSVWTEDGFGDPDLPRKFFNAITGMNVSRDELWESCERVFTLERAIACREGRRRKDDDFNNDWYEYGKKNGVQPEGLPGSGVVGRSKGRVYEPEKLRIVLDRFYNLVGWNYDGVPTEKRLKDLGLGDVAADLKKRGVLA